MSEPLDHTVDSLFEAVKGEMLASLAERQVAKSQTVEGS